MSANNSDNAWKAYGKKNAYFGVLSHEEFKDENLTAESLAIFFKTGTEYVDDVFSTVKRYFNVDFSPQSILDFGCGTGRLIIPFAKKCTHAVGVDISPDMLKEAERNAQKLGVENVSFKISDDALSAVAHETFDLVNSYIVLQHINVKRGMKIIEGLIEKVNPKGIGVLQVTFYADKSWLRKTVHYLRARVPLVNNIVNLAISRPFSEPLMQMNPYDLNEVFYLLQKNGVKNSHLRYEAHGNCWGVTIFFQKP